MKQKIFTLCLLIIIAMPFILLAQAHREWVARYNGMGSGLADVKADAIDSSGNIYVAGFVFNSATDNNYALIKYNASGALVWMRTYDGDSHLDDRASAIALDNAGNVYITGSSGTAFNYFTIKYDNNGTKTWAVRYDDPYHGADYAKALAVDSSGSVYVTGSSWQGMNQYDITTVKYDANGNQLWVQNYDGPSHYSETPSGLKLDSSGSLYVVG